VAIRRLRVRAGVRIERSGRQIRQADETVACQDDGPFQNIAQLAYIARPIIPMKYIEHFGIDSRNARTVLLVQILQHDIGDLRDIFFMFTQRRQHDLEDT